MAQIMTKSTGMNQAFLASLRDHAQNGVRDRMFKDAKEVSNDLLKKLGDAVALQCECRAIHGSIKDKNGRAAKKVAGEYGGDWYELKDAVRMTIVAPNPGKIAQVRYVLRQRCQPQHGMGIMKDAVTLPAADPCGYSGLNMVLRLTNGRPGEIQVNIPEILYAKMKPTSFQDNLGRELYDKIYGRYRIEGGLGHTLYEVWRMGPCSREGVEAAALSKKYYAYFRGAPQIEVYEELTAAIDKLKADRCSQFNLIRIA